MTERSMTPSNGATSPPLWAEKPEEEKPDAPAVEAAPPPEPAPAADTDHETLLAQKDQELKALEERINGIQGASKQAQDERMKLVQEVARLHNERESIERERDAQLQARDALIAEQSQATQTLSEKTRTLEEQLGAERAKATKLEVLAQEFPHLLKYAQYIPASSDPDEVRQYAQSFSQVRESDLGEQRQLLTGSHAMRTVPSPGAVPVGQAVNLADPVSLQQRLDDAMAKGDAFFEEELSAAIRAIDAARPRS